MKELINDIKLNREVNNVLQKLDIEIIHKNDEHQWSFDGIFISNTVTTHKLMDTVDIYYEDIEELLVMKYNSDIHFIVCEYMQRTCKYHINHFNTYGYVLGKYVKINLETIDRINKYDIINRNKEK